MQAHARQRDLTYTLRPRVQFVVRADELAYFLYGENRIASWMSGRNWRDYTPPKGRIVWQQIVLSNEASLRSRRKSVTESVNDFSQK